MIKRLVVDGRVENAWEIMLPFLPLILFRFHRCGHAHPTAQIVAPFGFFIMIVDKTLCLATLALWWISITYPIIKEPVPVKKGKAYFPNDVVFVKE